MHNPYVLHSENDVKEMLMSIGLSNLKELFDVIPDSIRLKRELDLPAPLNEGQLDLLVREISRKNSTVLDNISFLGNGLYEHHVPAVVDYLSERGELLTSYTPYQPKMSQGSLEILWDYQNKMKALLGVNTVNASSYDGSTSFVDAFNMVIFSSAHARKNRFQIAETVWHQTKLIFESSMAGKAEILKESPWKHDGKLDLDLLETQFAVKAPDAFGFQCPNAFGVIEDIDAINELCKKYNVISVLYYNPLLSGAFVPPGELGIDIICGEGQMLGNHLNAGGATFGFLGCHDKFSSSIPGRIVGIKCDAQNNPYFSLVNEEREQHVARDKATSNICSNQASCVMKAAIYLSLKGSDGLKKIVDDNVDAAYYFCSEIVKIPGVKLVFNAAFFNEFIIEVNCEPQQLLNELKRKNIYGGILVPFEGMERCISIAVTETKTIEQLDFVISNIKNFLNSSTDSLDIKDSQISLIDKRELYNSLPRLSGRKLIESVPERKLVQLYTKLSHKNYSVDSGIYPLGSCTMKYNPKRNDKYANLDAFKFVHPSQPVEDIQGTLRVLYELELFIAELTGMSAVSLQAAAGAHGEFTGLLMMRKYFQSKGESRDTLLIADSAHGTNPSTAAMVGFRCEIISTNDEGMLDLNDLKNKMGRNVAGLMITNPSTLGLFEENIESVAALVHEQGGLLYYDGANMNALMGLVRPGDMGFDIVHLNVHKTLSTPHGGGGPGAGPVAVKEKLTKYLPVPQIVYSPEDECYKLRDHCMDSIGKLKQYYGHFSVLIRAWSYIRTLGAKGLKEASEYAVLNANYIQYHLNDFFPAAFNKKCMHECLLRADSVKKSVNEISNILISQGFHPPTMVGAGCVWYPGELSKAMLIEPTETESKETLDSFINAMKSICE
ncbi:MULTISPECIES: aminomethyl-transferring glycine dehydrogenase subunit GcvPB [unclassified Pantoea]|uniref:aminomethyl-transferring glycine dehydrogenase subunit GcvPB n=1 Tax=unclassified Pantoea TaxID=2630326 RepID=UPI0024778077|nr:MULTISPECIES: aminomethyl-transferring glycine dehydrogenase subunit GcvPB [unclassified Pantoea]GME39921.1 aminomethyl-transferring glycine dehydrogenase [Pantoea sp. QMID1]GME40481.1 aminomethyl-transferring glycine dehydrogenase [Pantoea sp. QMID3]GME54884.1 aminomethyl-transferring glycine dehydrogenase [Pantoea sp. QMID4]GME55886.1 aminomethyl-transferring glycine dehydrogenase [Pantoea sp. QMID2]